MMNFALKKLTKPIVKWVRSRENWFKIPAIVVGACFLGYSASGLVNTYLFSMIELSALQIILLSCLITSVIAAYCSGDIKWKKEKPSKNMIV